MFFVPSGDPGDPRWAADPSIGRVVLDDLPGKLRQQQDEKQIGRRRLERMARVSARPERGVEPRELVLRARLQVRGAAEHCLQVLRGPQAEELELFEELDRKSTRLNSSHVKISYA